MTTTRRARRALLAAAILALAAPPLSSGCDSGGPSGTPCSGDAGTYIIYVNDAGATDDGSVSAAQCEALCQGARTCEVERTPGAGYNVTCPRMYECF